MEKLIYVLIATTNDHPDHLKRTVNSYLAQVGVHFQILITIHQSDKSNLRRLKRIKKKNPSLISLNVLKRKEYNRHTLNKYEMLNSGFNCIHDSTTHYQLIAFAPVGSVANPDKLVIESNSFNHKTEKVVYSSCNIMSNIMTLAKRKAVEYNFAVHLNRNIVGESAIVSHNLLKKHMPLRLELNQYAMWDLFLRIYKGEGLVFEALQESTWKTFVSEKREGSFRDQVESAKDRIKMLNRHI